MAGERTAIITGANSGLGLGCARALLAREENWHVVLAVRDRGRGEAALAQLGGPERGTVLDLDLASLASVHRFTADERLAALPPLRALVCNAGIQVISGTRFTEDGIELTFGVNHLGHFAVVQGLLGRLAHPARIAIVASDTHDPARSSGMPAPRYTTAEALAHPEPDDSAEAGRRRYTTSKLCNVMFAYELDRQLGHGTGGVTVNAFNPGLMPGSGLARDYGPVQRFAWRFVLPAMRVLPQVRGTCQSGRHLAELAADSALEGVTGVYFDGRKQIKSSEDSYDEAKARELWETSERLLAGAGGTDSSPI
jgi:NAD(P)-dependent dehydrogenase (short-subunit alcohol dehydrogenase family)